MSSAAQELEQITTTVRTANRIGVVQNEQRYLLVEPSFGGYRVHLVHNPAEAELKTRPGSVPSYRDKWLKPVIHERGFITYSEDEWGPLPIETIDELARWQRTQATNVRLLKVHDTGVLRIVHVQHPTGMRAYRWKLMPLHDIARDKWRNRIDF